MPCVPSMPSIWQRADGFWRSRCAQQICRRSIAQKPSALARSPTRMPRSAPYSGSSVAREPSVTILNTVAAAVAIVHSASKAPASSQVVPSVCFTAAPSNRHPVPSRSVEPVQDHQRFQQIMRAEWM